MNNQGLLSSGFGMVMRNKRYIFWFWLLNLTLAEFGTAAFRRGTSAIMDHSLYATRALPSLDMGVVVDLIMRPDFGHLNAMTMPALYFSILFFIATALFLPGVFAGYASTYRLPRQDFFRACGRNLWRFIRIMIIAGIIMGIIAAALFAANDAIAKKAEESTTETLPFELQMIGLAIIFLIMTTLRIWFDLAEADTVLADQRAVRRSIGAAFKHTFRSLGRLLGSYVISTIVAAIFLVGGLWIWLRLIGPTNHIGAFVIAQLTLFLLLIPRFWQRGIAVSYWENRMLVPVVAVQPIEPTPEPVIAAPPVVPVPEPSPITTSEQTPHPNEGS
ncbi:MAG TPA: hypothetical protein VGS27_25360 [Candidatus Sulfotelmatobacter sp.]|nr:hypothetical protein [Candidatus Sulfotelmatobacter sp.]